LASTDPDVAMKYGMEDEFDIFEDEDEPSGEKE
jgi:hypothetical protein